MSRLAQDKPGIAEFSVTLTHSCTTVTVFGANSHPHALLIWYSVSGWVYFQREGRGMSKHARVALKVNDLAPSLRAFQC
jgi:hypothetical protein